MNLNGINQNISSIIGMLQRKPPSASDMANHIMKELDTSGDGSLNADEINAGGDKAKRILGADSNKDGQVTMDELLADITKNQQAKHVGRFEHGMAQGIMKALDSNGDNQLSTDEISKSSDATEIQAADANGDGTVTMQELLAYLAGNDNEQSHTGNSTLMSQVVDQYDQAKSLVNEIGSSFSLAL